MSALLCLIEPTLTFSIGGRTMPLNIIPKKITEEKANSLVESVIILPLIFIIIYALIIVCFIVHDRSTLEASAKRGVIYAAHCISDPNYSSILEQSGNQSGQLDISVDIFDNDSFSFKEVGKNIKPYRYLTGSSGNTDNKVKSEVESIVNETRIPWRTIEVDDIKFTKINKIFYQDVTVTLKADYPIPKFFGAFGLDTEFEYLVSAKMAVNDPDEFIRNADMVVDLITDIDNVTGNHVSNAVNKIHEIASKLVDWLKI